MLLLLTLSYCWETVAAVADVVNVETQEAAAASDTRSAVVHIGAREVAAAVADTVSSLLLIAED
jgi:hypothetical protein